MPKKYRNPGKPERAPLVPIEIEKLPTTRARMANPQVVKTDFDDIDTILTLLETVSNMELWRDW